MSSIVETPMDSVELKSRITRFQEVQNAIVQQVRRVIVKTVGYLVDAKDKHPDSGRVPYQVSYHFEDTSVILDIVVEQVPEASTLTYILPIIFYWHL